MTSWLRRRQETLDDPVVQDREISLGALRALGGEPFFARADA
jgi:hypothetical protein